MSIGVGLGLDDYPFDNHQQFWDWVTLCDQEGVDSIWQSDRLISRTPHLECLSTMAALAGGSKRIKFGMNVASMALRNPVITAKACATIDVLSGGRLLPAFGVGLGTSADFKGTGTATQGRGSRTNERLEIMSRLWSGETINYQGQYHQLTDACIRPIPIKQPLPLWVGGSSPAAIERTARWGTGWQAGLEGPDQTAQVIYAIKQRLIELGRHIDEDHYGAGFAFRIGKKHDSVVADYQKKLAQHLGVGAAHNNLIVAGEPERIIDHIKSFHEAGVHKFVLRPTAIDGKDFIQQTHLFIEQLLPKVIALNN